MPEKIPSFDLYKKLDTDLVVEFNRLEESYHEYDSSHPHRHNYYEILFFQKTGGFHEIDFRHLKVTANSIHFVSPEQVHVLRRKRNVTGYVISFTNDVLLTLSPDPSFINQFKFFDISCPKPSITFKKNETKQFLELINRIETEFNSSKPDKKQMMAFLIGQLLISCKRSYGNDLPSSHGSDLTTKYRELINTHFRTNKSVSEYAGMLAITPGHLNDMTHKVMGKTAGELIHERIILEAKRLLYHSSLSIKEIGSELNYDDPSYFNRFFRKNTGKTPDQFRQNIREKYH